MMLRKEMTYKGKHAKELTSFSFMKKMFVSVFTKGWKES